MSATEVKKADRITVLFDRYKGSMQRIAHGILRDHQYAEDAVSEAMIKIIRNIDMVDDVESRQCANFVYTITKNTAIDNYRKRQKLNEVFVPNGDSIFVDHMKDNVDCSVFESRYGFGEQIERYMDRLEEVEADIISLKYADGFNLMEISRILEMPEETVRKKIQRIRKKLEIMITEGGQSNER